MKTFRILRILRALRPLRLIARARSLRVLISALWESVLPIISTCGIAIAAYALCSLLGMQLLRGKMKMCSDTRWLFDQITFFLYRLKTFVNSVIKQVFYNPTSFGSIVLKQDCIGVDSSGFSKRWISYPVNWDNLFNGIVAMFVLTSQDNWQNYMASPFFILLCLLPSADCQWQCIGCTLIICIAI